MAIYELQENGVVEIEPTTFGREMVRERSDLQRVLRESIDVVAPNCMVLAEEFGDWEESRRRIDLLGLDKEANLVVLEIKRTEDGGHMELQAIRYAAMVSAMTFDQAVEAHRSFLAKQDSEEDARERILTYLEWDEPDEEHFGQSVKIILVSAEFSRELTTSVMWLNDNGLDVRCIRVKPYRHIDRLLLDIQQIIPLPEAAAYQIQIREKLRKEQESRISNRDFTRYDVTLNGKTHEYLWKRGAIYLVVRHLCESGVSPEEIALHVKTRSFQRLFKIVDGECKSDEFVSQAINVEQEKGRSFDPGRYFTDDDELIYFQGKTLALSNQWGKSTFQTIQDLIKAFPEKGITCVPSENRG